MRARSGWLWLASAAFLGSYACGQGTGQGPDIEEPGNARAGTVEEPMSGDPLPNEPIIRSGCQDETETITRWLGWKPRVPLAITDKEMLGTAGQPCCAPWARAGSKWRAVDAWGQVLGTASIGAGQGREVTHCFELELVPESLDKRAVVFASEKGSWKPPAKVEWEPTPGEAAALDATIEKADGVYIDPELLVTRKDLRPANDRPRLYFRLPVAVGGAGEADEQPTLFAVVGGPLLVIAYVGGDGAWYFAHVEHDLMTPTAPPDPYTPIAVFDMDGDRYPEVLYQHTDGDAWADAVLRVEPFVRTCWSTVAESVGGVAL